MTKTINPKMTKILTPEQVLKKELNKVQKQLHMLYKTHKGLMITKQRYWELAMPLFEKRDNLKKLLSNNLSNADVINNTHRTE